MHWQALGDTVLTRGQGLVLRGHPLMTPGFVDVSKPSRRSVLPPISDATRKALERLAPNWCGTCERIRRKTIR